MRTLKRVLTSESKAADAKADAKTSTVRVTGKTLRRVVNNPARDVILYLYNGDAEFMSKYESVAKAVKKLEAEVTFAHIDVSRNGQDVVEIDVKDYPIIAMFRAHAKPNEEPPKLEFPESTEELRYFIDRYRWHKDMPKLTTAKGGFVAWEEQIVALDANNFQEFAKRYSKFMAMFYTKTSSQSRSFRQEFGLALHALGGPAVVKFAKIDCLLQTELEQEGKPPIKAEINRKLCAMHDVTGVPSLVWFDFTKYTGVDSYNTTWTKLPFEQVTRPSVVKFIKAQNVHAEL